MYKATIKATGEKMDKTIAVIQKDLATLRAGRANPQILDKITVDYYGTPTALNQVGNISSPEPRMLVIAPWEASMISPIEKAIQKSDIGINPSNDGKVIRLMVPELTAERRKDLCKQVKKRIEEGKVAIRSIRRDAMESIKKMKKDSQITEDDQKTAEKELPIPRSRPSTRWAPRKKRRSWRSDLQAHRRPPFSHSGAFRNPIEFRVGSCNGLPTSFIPQIDAKGVRHVHKQAI